MRTAVVSSPLRGPGDAAGHARRGWPNLSVRRITDYPRERRLGAGGQGEVFLVRDPSIPDARWALKVFREHEAYEAEKTALLGVTKAALASVPRVKDYFDSDRAIVMSYLEGATAKDGNPRPWRRVLGAMQRLAGTIERIHAAGFLYLDLKPANVIFGSDGQLYLVDFSLAQPIATARAVATGTPGFAAPEQMRSEGELSMAADAFALGALAYFMLSGEAPRIDRREGLARVPSGLERLVCGLLVESPSARPKLRTVQDYTLEHAEREMLRCPKCGMEQRSGAEACVDPNCQARFRIAAVVGPDFRGLRRELPEAVLRDPTAASNDVLRELLQPGRQRFPFDRTLRLLAEEIAKIPGFKSLQAPPLLRHLITFYPHQIEAAQRALQDMRGNAILADEVGLGKTIEAGLITKELLARKLIQRILVVAPRHLLDQWATEMSEKFDLAFKVYEPPRGVDWRQPWLVAPFGALAHSANFRKIQRLPAPYDLVIVDEMHNLLRKAGEPKQGYEHLKQMARSYTLLLSATPIRHHVKELYYLVNLIRPGSFPTSVDAFLRRYERFGEKASLRDEIQRVMIRNHRSNLPPDALPPRRVVEKVMVEATTSEIDLMQRAERHLRAARRRDPNAIAKAYSSVASQAEVLGEPSRSGSSAKLVQAIRIVRSVSDQVVVFAQDRATCDYVAHGLRIDGLDVIQLMHGLPRRELVRRFYAFKRSPSSVLVATDMAAEGRNLQFACHMVNFDLPLNPLRLEQRIGRVDRLGQNRAPQIYSLVVEDSFEDLVYDVFAQGLKMFDLIVGELASVLAELDDRDEATLDDVLADLWLRHGGSSGALRAALQRLRSDLSTARAEYDADRRRLEALDRELF
jgi:serine/threonine protein kinase